MQQALPPQEMQQALPPQEMQQALSPCEMLPAGMHMGEMAQTTTVQVEEEQPPPPRDHLVWSFCNTLYCNICCLGFLAFFFSVKSRDCKVLGDHRGALTYGSTAKCLNITALVFNIIFTVIVIVIIAVVLSRVVTRFQYPT